MSLARRFRAAVVQQWRGERPTPEQLPVILCRTCVEVLPIAGAGLSITSALRLPLGSSDPAVALAERLQATLGDGPCVAAAATGEPVVASSGLLSARWPVLFDHLAAQTPFRSIVSVPFSSSRRILSGALDLYLDTPGVPFWPALRERVSHIAESVGVLLFEDVYGVTPDGEELPAWLETGPAEERMRVWVAVGMLMGATGSTSDTDTLDRLRAYAFRTGSTLDEVAAGLMARRIPLSAVS